MTKLILNPFLRSRNLLAQVECNKLLPISVLVHFGEEGSIAGKGDHHANGRNSEKNKKKIKEKTCFK